MCSSLPLPLQNLSNGNVQNRNGKKVFEYGLVRVCGSWLIGGVHVSSMTGTGFVQKDPTYPQYTQHAGLVATVATSRSNH